MPLKKIKAGVKKGVKVGKAVVAGTKDYNKQLKDIDKAAEKKVGKSGSRVQDVKNQGKERAKMRKEQGVSIKKSIKARLK